MRYLLLSTYSSGSKNSGDDLVAKSLVTLLWRVKSNKAEIKITNVVDTSNDEMPDISGFKAIIAPALRPMLENDHVGIQISEKRDRFFRSGYERGIPLFAVGAGCKFYPGSLSQSKILKIESSEKERLLRYFGGPNNRKISCRDVYTETVLKKNGIDCFGTTGDCGLFDLLYLNKALRIPEKIQRIAVSMPHNRHHWKTAFELADTLSRKISCEVFCTFHSSTQLFNDSSHGKSKGVNIVNLSGGMEQLNFYDNVDLHVGFRLHAHIYFLRTRKPSLLIAEDSRGTGHLSTVEGLGFPVAPVSAFMASKVFPGLIHREGGIFKRCSPKLINTVNLITREIEVGYPKTKNTLSIIDHLWEKKMKPFLEMIPE